MLERFVPLHELLVPAPTQPAHVPEPTHAPSQALPEDELAADVRRFRAGLLDAFDVVRERLLREVASEVLARELHLKPADIGVVVSQALERLDSPLTVRVSPSDADALAACDIRVIPDASLRSGDAVFDVRDGTIDVSLGVRLDRVLRGLARG
jgi:flagellar biosynthesis/type III secretory pathway protein FliH